MSDLDTTRLADFILLTDRMAATLRDMGESLHGDPDAVELADEYDRFKASEAADGAVDAADFNADEPVEERECPECADAGAIFRTSDDSLRVPA